MSENTLIERFINAMEAKDCVALSECFALKSRLFDFCPIGHEMANYHVYGRESIEMFFNNKFFFNKLSISDPVYESDNTANYVVSYEGQYLHVKATIEERSADDLIQLITIRPA